MKEELEQKLYNKYPQFFSNKDKGIMDSCMGWGCECGDGWYDILSTLCWMIKQHEDNKEWRKKYLEQNDPEKLKQEPEYFPVKFDQIKEKYGTLRVYFSGGDEYIEGLVSMAEAISGKTCETCGNKGKPTEGGWITTLCDNCRGQL